MDSTVIMLIQNQTIDSIAIGKNFESYYTLAKNFVDISISLNENLLKILAGSVVLLFGSDFIRPVDAKFRTAYLLFIPSWIAMGISFYYSNMISRISATLPTFKSIDVVKILIYNEGGLSAAYSCQSLFFSISVFFIFLWLLSYLYWWIFHEGKSLNSNSK